MRNLFHKCLTKLSTGALKIICSTTLVAGSTESFALAQKCFMESQNSCWTIDNQTKGDVSLKCSDDQSYIKDRIWSVKLQGREVIQFDSGWGDGLGFPEPGVAISCLVTSVGTTKKSEVRFKSIGWGDAVYLYLDSDFIILQQETTWTPYQSLEQFFDWSVESK